MRLSAYLKDNLINIVTSLVTNSLVIILLLLFKVNKALIVIITFIMVSTIVIILVYNYLRRKSFYNEYYKNLKELEKKYLILELISEPNFLDGKILYNSLYDINKDMIEEIKKLENSDADFRDYLELWCHEIKTPVATSYLIVDNNKNEVTQSIKEEISKIEYYIEQMLYYARMENANQDYHIVNVNLKDVINEAIKSNKKMIMDKQIKISIDEMCSVNSDQKWLLYIINQIVNNAVKYSNQAGTITFKSNVLKNQTILTISDTGIGINDYELNKIFTKGFTGTNGRILNSSTGMGLYLCHKICEKLGYQINIDSIVNKGTTVTIVFPKNSLINEVK